MSWTVTTWVTLGPRNYLISKSFGIATSCGTGDRSTRSTCAAGGPCASARSRSPRADSAPSAITSTDPSRRLRASPRSPRRVACRHTHQRNPTPWTWPYTRKRVAATQALPLPPLRGAPPVPPDVDRRDPRQHRQHNEHGASGVAPRLLIEHLEDHVDRKSTRLNSSHMSISYAVFCLKKKKKNHNHTPIKKINQNIEKYTDE